MPALIACHSTADFDSLAGACGMALLNPGSRIILPGGAEGAVHAFLKEYGPPAGALIALKELDGFRVDKLILIDCHDPEHLGALSGRLKPRPPVEVVDHHPGAAPARAANAASETDAGATSTLVAERLLDAGIEPPPLLATLLLIGIHEDTGSFSFNDVKPRDHAAAAWLWGFRPDPALLRRWLAFHAPAVPGALLKLLRATELMALGRVTVAFCELEADEPDPAAVPALNGVLEITGADGALLLQAARGRVSLAARGDGVKFDCNALCARLGGGGHPTAASAALAHTPRAAARQAALAALRAQFPPPHAARDLMQAPAEWASGDEKAGALLARLEALRLKRIPVLRAGRAKRPSVKALLGVATQEALREAVRHGHGDSPAAALVHGGATVVAPDAPLAGLAAREAAGDPLYLVADRGGALRGALSRRRLLAAVAPVGAPDRASRLAPEFLAARLRELPAPAAALLAAVRRAAKARKADLHLVGGPVRDLLLQRPLSDLDLVVDAPLKALLAPLAKRKGVTIVHHERFGTATVKGRGASLDLVRARREHYVRPGALPEVSPADLAADLRRRDFTLNAMAIRLPADGGPPALVDPLGGLADLQAGRLRALHGLSFIEDPTRMLRAVRFLTRFHFTLAPDTDRLLREAVRLGALTAVSGERLAAELALVAAEPEPLRALEWLDATGLLDSLCPGAVGRGPALERARALYARVERHRAEFPDETPDRLALFLMPVLLGLKPDAHAAALSRLTLSSRTRALLTAGRDLRWRIGEPLKAGTPQLQQALARLEVEELLLLAALPPYPEKGRAIDDYLRVGRFRRAVLGGHALQALGAKPGPGLGALHRELTARVQAGELSGRAAESRFVQGRLRGRPPFSTPQARPGKKRRTMA